MKFTFFLFLIFVQGVSLKAQNNPCACCEPAFRQFDFWIGEWEVKDTSG
ncbi:hypothetical protein [Croceimicrobium hydrocarbonivorans]|uniref:Uncharacterized protein n=1 Tax=Croceimicrobium hydrocarbonivorans TaxID=2761580 RepID=A0A7H0VD29_9FLAO|nr:hypothetical protein [Croceimicrobium hydrocarbonivorans]QNR23627.1 hypothetical protein H4K34_14765 [Croceimicrobium hydrocarbonivorans]